LLVMSYRPSPFVSYSGRYVAENCRKTKLATTTIALEREKEK